MTEPKAPDSEPVTPPAGGRRVKPMTEHAMIDLGALQERTADKLIELAAKVDAMQPHVEDIPEMKTMLKLALAPRTMPAYVRVSAPLAAVALLVIAVAASLYLARSASASQPEPSPRVQAQR